MYVALMDSNMFTWLACGRSAKEAEEAIAKRWNTDDGYHREPHTAEELKEAYGITVVKLRSGECEMW